MIFWRARARYAFMLKLPPTVYFEDLCVEAQKYEQCRFGNDHAAWRRGYFGIPWEGDVEISHTGATTPYRCGLDACRADCCPLIPPGMRIEKAQRNWGNFEQYWIEWKRDKI